MYLFTDNTSNFKGTSLSSLHVEIRVLMFIQRQHSVYPGDTYAKVSLLCQRFFFRLCDFTKGFR